MFIRRNKSYMKELSVLLVIFTMSFSGVVLAGSKSKTVTVENKSSTTHLIRYYPTDSVYGDSVGCYAGWCWLKGHKYVERIVYISHPISQMTGNSYNSEYLAYLRGYDADSDLIDDNKVFPSVLILPNEKVDISFTVKDISNNYKLGSTGDNWKLYFQVIHDENYVGLDTDTVDTVENGGVGASTGLFLENRVAIADAAYDPSKVIGRIWLKHGNNSGSSSGKHSSASQDENNDYIVDKKKNSYFVIKDN